MVGGVDGYYSLDNSVLSDSLCAWLKQTQCALMEVQSRHFLLLTVAVLEETASLLGPNRESLYFQNRTRTFIIAVVVLFTVQQKERRIVP